MTQNNQLKAARAPLEVPGGAARVVLHVCCAVCAGEPLEALLEAGITPLIFFCNPNIDEREEYERRKAETIRLAGRAGVDWVDDDYDPSVWREVVRGLELEPERGVRCDRCFLMRLNRAAAFCRARGMGVLATTLGISPLKNLEQVNRAGQVAVEDFPDVLFWEVNWRARGGSERMFQIARQQKMYRQNYCGCAFSRRDGRPEA